jgi:multidrug efflux pump subunit AcrA (membrane-fusion protein)
MRHRLDNLKKKKFAAIFIICLILIGMIIYFGGKKDDESSRAAIKPEVKVMEITRRDMYRRIILSGQTAAKAKVVIAPKYTGKIVAVNVDLGDAVKAGDVLLVQDTEEVELLLRQNEATVRAADADVVQTRASYDASLADKKAQYEHDLLNYSRYAELFKEGAVSKESLDNARQQMVTSEAAYNTLKNQAVEGKLAASIEGKVAARDKSRREADSLEKQRADLILTAPRDGIIAYRAAEVGAIASAGQSVLTIVDNSSLHVDCLVSEQDAAVLKTDEMTEVSIESLGESFGGRIIYISPSVDSTEKSYLVRIELLNINSHVKDGMFAKSEIKILQRQNAVFVPKEAIVEKNGQTYVFVLGENNKAERREVATGLRNDEAAEILTGLKEGEQLILNNQARLKDGIEVTTEQG